MTALRPEPHTLLMVSAGIDAGQAGVDQRLAGRRLAAAALHHLAHDDVVDGGGIDAGARDGLADGDRARAAAR